MLDFLQRHVWKEFNPLGGFVLKSRDVRGMVDRGWKELYLFSFRCRFAFHKQASWPFGGGFWFHCPRASFVDSKPGEKSITTKDLSGKIKMKNTLCIRNGTARLNSNILSFEWSFNVSLCYSGSESILLARFLLCQPVKIEGVSDDA